MDIIVEALVVIAITVEVVEGLLTLEVFKLHNHIWVDFLGSLHELVHEVLLLAHGNALGAQTQVEGILQVRLISSTAVQDNRESLLRVNTGRSCVEGQFADLVHMHVSLDFPKGGIVWIVPAHVRQELWPRTKY